MDGRWHRESPNRLVARGEIGLKRATSEVVYSLILKSEKVSDCNKRFLGCPPLPPPPNWPGNNSAAAVDRATKMSLGIQHVVQEEFDIWTRPVCHKRRWLERGSYPAETRATNLALNSIFIFSWGVCPREVPKEEEEEKSSNVSRLHMRIYGPLIHSLVTVGRLGSEIMASFASSRSGRPHYEDRDLVWGTPHITVNPPKLEAQQRQQQQSSSDWNQGKQRNYSSGRPGNCTFPH